MSNDTKQRNSQRDGPKGAQVESDGSALADTRSEMDRLFAAAAKSFDSMSENSREFLRRSTQTGGQ